MAQGSTAQLSITKKPTANVDSNEDYLVYEIKEEKKIHSLTVKDYKQTSASPFVNRIADNALDCNSANLSFEANNSVLQSSNIGNAVKGYVAAKSVTPSSTITNILARKPSAIIKGRAMGRGPAR